VILILSTVLLNSGRIRKLSCQQIVTKSVNFDLVCSGQRSFPKINFESGVLMEENWDFMFIKGIFQRIGHDTKDVFKVFVKAK
jgi:hypothetical protein